MPYSTRVLSKHEDIASFEGLAALLRADHPHCKLTIESREVTGESGEFADDEDEFQGEDDELSGAELWQSLLLSSDDDVEIAVLECHPVYPGSIGDDQIADFLEEIRDARPESGAAWLRDFLAEVKTIYSFEHLQGAEFEDGSNALHALRSAIFQRGESILQADLEGFTNEDGHHIVWQFADTVSGAWNMAVLQDGTWHPFKMDLGDPDQREAFLSGVVPSDVSSVQLPSSKD